MGQHVKAGKALRGEGSCGGTDGCPCAAFQASPTPGFLFFRLMSYLCLKKPHSYGGFCMVHPNRSEFFWLSLDLISASPSSSHCHISSLLPLGDLGCHSDIGDMARFPRNTEKSQFYRILTGEMMGSFCARSNAWCAAPIPHWSGGVQQIQNPNPG